MSASAYPPIEDHGLIGDLQTTALVARNGSIDWFCAPRFDSPSIFAALLDSEKGGHFAIAPVVENCVVKQLYLPDTAVLVTRFLTEDGVGEVMDFMPIHDPEVASDVHRIVRIVRTVRGELTYRMRCAPRLDYGRQQHGLELTEHHATFTSPQTEVALHSTAALTRDGQDVTAEFRLEADQVAGAIFATGDTDFPEGALGRQRVGTYFDQTIRFWRDWIGQSTYTGRWREMVARSAITLKLMTYAPSGALVAAPTAALPEQVGGGRNWDYRFTWIRDASFSLSALMNLGFTSEAEAFLAWLADRVHEQAGDESGPLKIMYRVDGSSDLDEQELGHLEGYKGSRPVRIGNGAADQLQLDIYGEAIDAIHSAVMLGRSLSWNAWGRLCDIVDWLADNWDQPDEGVWETRGGRQAFVYSRIMSWVAFDRALRIGAMRGLPGDRVAWRTARDAIYRQVMEQGYDAEQGAFVQHYGTDVLDAAVLKMPLVGFIAPQDPIWLSTLDRMAQEIVSDSLVYRYNPSASPDGLEGDEGTFSLCTFWYVDALARAGRLNEARLTFEKMLTYANHLGLYSEEIGPTGEQLGNFPQAFTHLALINAAVRLDARLNGEQSESWSLA